jgi:hypothetical protein
MSHFVYPLFHLILLSRVAVGTPFLHRFDECAYTNDEKHRGHDRRSAVIAARCGD